MTSGRTVQDADAVVGGHLQQEGVLEVGGRRGPSPRRHVAGAGTRLHCAEHKIRQELTQVGIRSKQLGRPHC